MLGLAQILVVELGDGVVVAANEQGVAAGDVEEEIVSGGRVDGRGEVIGDTGELDEPIEDGEEGGPGVGGSRCFEGGAVKLDRAAEVAEEGGEVIVEVDEGPVKATEDEAEGVGDLAAGRQWGTEGGRGGEGGEVGVHGSEGSGLGGAVGEEGGGSGGGAAAGGGRPAAAETGIGVPAAADVEGAANVERRRPLGETSGGDLRKPPAPSSQHPFSSLARIHSFPLFVPKLRWVLKLACATSGF